MKNKIAKIIALALLATVNNVQAQGNEKVEKARKDVLNAKKELEEAQKDSAIDFHAYKAEAQNKIAENKIKIAELKAKSPKDNSKEAANYKKKVVALEEKNNELNRRIQRAKYTKQTSWMKFKEEFKHDMDGVGKSIGDLFKSNTN